MKASILRTWLLYGVMAIAILATASPAKAGIIVPGTEQRHIDFAQDPMFDAVGWVRGVNANGSFAAGSGVLIAPDWVLTVGHVVTRDDMTGWTDMQFSFNNAFDTNRILHAADAWFAFPGFVSDHGAGTANDIGLIHLAEPITDVTPADIFWGEVPGGTHAYLSGFGVLGYTPPSRLLPFDGIRRAGENIVDDGSSRLSTTGSQFLTMDFGPVWGTPTLPLEMGLSQVDSGGGVFADINGQPYLIGLMAFANGDYYSTGAIKTAVYRDWIASHVPSMAVPEPGSLICLLTVAVIVVARRRRSHCLQGRVS